MKHKAMLLVAAFIANSYIANSQATSSLLWEISGNGLTQPSYLFGTVHMIPKKEFFFSDQMKAKFDACKALALEVDISSLSLSEKLEIAKQSLLPEGQTLENLLGPEKYTHFKTYLTDSLNIKEKRIAKYNRIKPFFVGGVVLKDYLGKIKAYEQEFLKYAKKNNMSVLGLETVEDQMAIIDQLNTQEQIDLLQEEINMQDYLTLIELYKTQDIDSLYNWSMASGGNDEEMMETMAFQRNQKWIANIQKQIEINPTFIAVGAMHLPGEKGVINLLKKEGYTLTPVID